MLAMLDPCAGFKWMAKVKLPTVNNIKNILDAQKFKDKKLVVITGTSSGLGKMTTKALLRSGKYHVIGAVRDLAKMDTVAKIEGFNENFTPMHLDLASFDSVHNFVKELDKFRSDTPIDRIVCNAAVYQPTLDYPKWSEDDIEQQMQINYLSHFLLVSKLMPKMENADDPRVVMVGSVTGNDNTVGGGGVYPVADLKDLEGLELGGKNPISMIDGYNFNGAKAYKDTKLCLMMISNMLHDRYHRQTGISFSSIYPGCIAESPLFREKRMWFRKYFPVFMKFVTGGFVGEEEAGQRLYQVIHDPRCKKSGVYWSWNGGPREGRGYEAIEKGGQIVGAGGAGGGWDSIFENDLSDKALDKEKTQKLWKLSCDITGAEWPLAYQPKSPCPTLKVVSLATGILNTYEDMQRIKKSKEGRVEMLKELQERKERRDKLRKEKQKRGGFLGDFGRARKQPTPSLTAATTGSMSVPLESKKAELKPTIDEAKEIEKLRNDAQIAANAKTLRLPEKKDSNPKETKENKESGFPNFASLGKKKPSYTIPPGHELLGDIPVVFNPENKATMARAGQPLSDVATQADQFIRYKCKKGECGTCEVQVNGKWVKACQTQIPQLSPGEVFGVTVRPVASSEKKKKPSKFFSPSSFVEGVVNNGLGMVGFVKECIEADPDFAERIKREEKIKEIASNKGGAAQPEA